MTLFPVRVDVYHKEQLVTKDEVEEVASDVWKWGKLAITKDSVMAIRIADVLDKYGFNEVAQHIRGTVSVYTFVFVYKYCTGSLQKGTIILKMLAVCCIHAFLLVSVCECT